MAAAKAAVLGELIGDAAAGVLEFMGQPPTPKKGWANVDWVTNGQIPSQSIPLVRPVEA